MSLTASSIPIYLEHRANFRLLQSLPSDAAAWSMLAPNAMVPETEIKDMVVPTQSSSPALVAKADTPPNWKDSWMRHIPLFGKCIVTGMNAMRLQTTLEQNADFIARDLVDGEGSQWVGKAVGIIDPRK